MIIIVFREDNVYRYPFITGLKPTLELFFYISLLTWGAVWKFDPFCHTKRTQLVTLSIFIFIFVCFNYTLFACCFFLFVSFIISNFGVHKHLLYYLLYQHSILLIIAINLVLSLLIFHIFKTDNSIFLFK